jgi:hypothetical protein
LHSTYWRFDPSSDPLVLAADGGPQSAPGTNCPRFPGSGCGTVTQTFTAFGAGTATVTAGRTTCGEALACSPSQSEFKLSVHVRAR